MDTSAARASEGVHSVVTGADLPEVGPIPVRVQVADQPLDAYLQPVLARERVRYVGEPVAVVLADDPYAAEDAAELVVLEVEELPAVLDLREADRAAELEMGYGDVEAAFANAAHVIHAEFTVGRHSGCRSRPEGCSPPRAAGGARWGTTKVPHFNRRVLASMLGPLEQSGCTRPTRVEGSGRGEFYPEDFLVPWLAARTGRPVKWIEDRSEHLVATNHLAAPIHAISAAFDRDHRLLAIADEVWDDTGAYIRTHGVLVADLTLSMLPGPYRVPAYRGTAHAVLTPRTPCGTYRGPGRYEGTFARERLLDLAAHDLGLDPLDLRRRNLLSPDELPLHRRLPAIGTAMTIDAGHVGGLLDRTIAESGFETWREGSARLRAQGRMVGTVAAIFMEKRARAARTRRARNCCRREWSGSPRGPRRAARASRPSSRPSPPSGSVWRPTTSPSCWATPTWSPRASARGRLVRPSSPGTRSPPPPIAWPSSPGTQRPMSWRSMPPTSGCRVAASRRRGHGKVVSLARAAGGTGEFRLGRSSRSTP